MKVSLITATFQSESVIDDNLVSVNAQECDCELEHIIQDGGSTDNTLNHIEKYKASVDYPVSVVSEKDEGFYDAVNKGVKRSCGDIIGLLNADDWFASPDVISSVVDAFERDPEIMIVYGDLDYVKQEQMVKTGQLVWRLKAERIRRRLGLRRRNQAGADLEDKKFRVVRRWRAQVSSPLKMRLGWMPPHPTVYVRRQAYEKAGYYRLDMGTAADYEWLLRLFVKRHFEYAYLPKVMVNMQSGGQSNASLKIRIQANRMDRKAWDVNGLKPSPLFRLMKPLQKLGQWM